MVDDKDERMSELTKRLHEYVNRWLDEEPKSDWWAWQKDFAKSIDLLEAQEARIAELEAALKPFSEAADDLDEHHKDGSPIWETSSAMGIDARHLRKAKELVP